MDTISKQQQAAQARALVEWLNGECRQPASTQRFAALLISTHVKGASLAMLKAATFGPEKFIERLPKVVAYSEMADSPRGFKPHFSGAHSIPLNMEAELRIRSSQVEFTLIPKDIQSQAIYIFGELLKSGNAARLRWCLNCGQYWYCAGRFDRRLCSVACKVAFWQKTPYGRKVKREYMRKWRSEVKRLWEAKQRGRRLRRGRKLHADLKKGE